MNDASLIRTTSEIARAALSTAGKLLDEDLLLCDRFRERRRAVSEEKSLSRVQRDVCESASKLADSSSKLPMEEDEKKRKSVMPMICFTTVSVYHG